MKNRALLLLMLALLLVPATMSAEENLRPGTLYIVGDQGPVAVLSEDDKRIPDNATVVLGRNGTYRVFDVSQGGYVAQLPAAAKQERLAQAFGPEAVAKADERALSRSMSGRPVRVLIESQDMPGLTEARKLSNRYAVATLDAEQLEAMAARPDVGRILLDEPMSILTEESINITGIDKVQALGLGGAGVRVCIVDTGLANDVVGRTDGVDVFGYDVQANDTDYADEHGHGTKVAYPLTVAAPSATLIIAKALDEDGNGYASDVIAGLEYCRSQSADIVSLSIGGSAYTGYCDADPVAKTVNELVDEGILVVAATGNSGLEQVRTPACASGALPVAASTKDDELAGYSNYNNATLLVAPGNDVLTRDHLGNTVFASGTSMAVPFVSATAALLLEDTLSDASSVTDLVIASGIPVEDGRFMRLDALRAREGDTSDINTDISLNQSPEQEQILFGVLERTSYNFSSETNAQAIVCDDETEGSPPTDGPRPSCEGTQTDQTSNAGLDVDDVSYMNLPDLGSNTNGWAFYNFSVQESEASVTALNFSWVGADEDGTITVHFHYWNDSASSWVTDCTATTSGSTVVNRSCSLDQTQAQDAIDATGNTYFLVQGTRGSGGASYMVHDFMELEVQYDIQAPHISGVVNYSIDATSAIINWSLDEAGNASVEWGNTTGLGTIGNKTAATATQHSRRLSRLPIGTLIYYNVTSCDVANNCNTSGPYNFTTIGYGYLNVSINGLANGTVVASGETFLLNATVSCLGPAGGACGTVTGYGRYNGSSSLPDAYISTALGAVPFRDLSFVDESITFAGISRPTNLLYANKSKGVDGMLHCQLDDPFCESWPKSAFTDSGYSNISSDDGAYTRRAAYSATDITIGELYNFHVNATSIDSLTFFWNGNAETGCANMSLYIFNYTDGLRQQVASFGNLSESDITVSFSGEGTDDFFNASSGYINVLMRGGGGFSCTQIIETDFVQLNVTGISSPTGPLDVGDSLNATWTVNATGASGQYLVDVQFNSTTYAANVTTNDTADRTVCIGSCLSVSGLAVDQTPVANRSTINVSATITDSADVSAAYAQVFYPNGTLWQNLSMSNVGSTYYRTFTVADDPLGNYSVTVWTNDTNGYASTAGLVEYVPYLQFSQTASVTIDGAFTDWMLGVNVSDDTLVQVSVVAPTNWSQFHAFANNSGFIPSASLVDVTSMYTNYSLGAAAYSSPVVAGDYLYVGGLQGTALILYQLNASNVSKQIANTTITASGTRLTTPAVAGNSVYVGSTDGFLYQRSAANVSTTVSSFNTGGAIFGSHPSVYGGYVYVGSNSKKLHQLDASSVATNVSQQSFFGSVRGSAAVGKDYVYIGDDDAIGGERFAQLNRTLISEEIDSALVDIWGSQSSPAVTNEYVYFIDVGGSAGSLRQLNASNVSQEIASYQINPLADYAPTVTDEYVFVVDGNGYVYQVNASNASQEIANFSTGNSIASSPMVAGGYLYVGNDDNVLYVLNASNISKQVANFSADGMIRTAPAIAQGFVYFVTESGTLYQLGTGVPDPITDIASASIANNDTHILSRIQINGTINFSTATDSYRLWLSNNSATGNTSTPEGETLPFAADHRVQINNSACSVYNASGSSIASCSYANDSDEIELSVTLSTLGYNSGEAINATWETAGVSSRYDIAPDSDSFIELTLLATDTDPPYISDVINYSITTSSVVINWSLDESGNASIEYGMTTSLGSVGNGTDSDATIHSRTLYGLDSETTYYYNVTSCDSTGNCNTSGPYNFMTLDASAPLVSGLAVDQTPVANQSTINVSGTITDTTGVSSAYAQVWYPNGTLWQNLSMSNTGSTYYRTFTVADEPLGNHSVTVWTNDSNGYAGTDGSAEYVPYLRFSQTASVTIDGAFSDWTLGVNVSDLLGVATTYATSDPGNWSLANVTSNIPGGRDLVQATYHPKLGGWLIFGGFAGNGNCDGSGNDACNGTYLFNTTIQSWQNLRASNPPSSRYYTAPQYDPVSELVIMHGGFRASGTTCDGTGDRGCDNTYAYNWTDNSWSALNPSAIPVPHYGFHTWYDPVEEAVMFYGGNEWLGFCDEGSICNRVYKYNRTANTWEDTNRDLAEAMYIYGSAYDDSRQRFYVFGGACNGACDFDWDNRNNMTYYYDSASGTWTQTNATGAPSARQSAAMSYDSRIDRIILHGGASGGASTCSADGRSDRWCNATWEYNFNSNSWRKIPVASDLVRNSATMFLENTSDQMLLFGGSDSSVADCDGTGTVRCNGTYVFSHVETTATGTDFSQLSAANNDTHILSRIQFYGTIDFSTATDSYRLWLSNDSGTGNTSTPEGETLPFRADYRVQINSSACTVYNASGSSISSCSYDNDTDEIELAVALSTLGYNTGEAINATWETASASSRYDIAPDSDSFVEFTITASGGGGGGSTVTNVPAGQEYLLESDGTTDVSVAAQTGVQPVLLRSADTGNYSALLYLNFTSSIDVSSMSSNVSRSSTESFIHNSSTVPGLVNKSLLIPRTELSDWVYVCPQAKSYSGVSGGCKGRVDLQVGQSRKGYDVSTTTYDGESYYLVTGITGTGGGEATNVTKCSTLDTPGSYVLVNDSISDYSTTCIRITNSSIALNCNGITIDGLSSGSGIFVDGASGDELTNVSVLNCHLNNFDYGITLDYTNDSRISGTNISTSFEEGLYVVHSVNNAIVQNRITGVTGGGESAIYMTGASTGNNVSNNTIRNNYYGFYFSGSAVADNIIYDNAVESNYEPVFAPQAGVNFWNATYDCAGPSNIVGGSCIGGNYWFGQEFQDNNADGIGDLAFTVDPNVDNEQVDYLPLVNATNSGNLTICQDLTYPGTYYMGGNITDWTTNCMIIKSSHVTLDCQGYRIDGTNVGAGVQVAGSSNAKLTNVTVKNCNLNNFDWPLYINYANNSRFVKNNISYSVEEGVYFINSENSTFAQNHVFGHASSNDAGLYLTGASLYNNFTNNTFENNFRNIDIASTSSENNTFYNNIFDTNYEQVSTNAAGNNFWNISYDCSGPRNIVGGLCMGGNYWVGQEFPDDDADNISDIPYGVDTQADYLPLVNASNSGNLSICQKITYPGTYYMGADIIDATSSCMEIISSNVTLDCQGYMIDGQSSGTGVQVRDWPSISWMHNVTIQNCNINHFDYTLTVQNVNHSTLYKNNFSGGQENGVSLNTASHANISYNRFVDYTRSNVHGFLFGPVTSLNNLTANTFDNNFRHIDITSSNADDNYIYNNVFGDYSYTITGTDGAVNFWNVSYDCAGPSNIVGGSCMGGNYWANREFQDNDADGIGDTPYGVGTGESDFLPLVNASNSGNMTVCQEISYPGTYYLGANISAGSEDCIRIVTSNVTLDCQGYTIDGPATGYRGIEVEGSSFAGTRMNVTIRNCHVNDFDYGIYLQYVNESLVIDNNVTSVDEAAIVLNYAGENNITGNRFVDNPSANDAVLALFNEVIGNHISANVFNNSFRHVDIGSSTADNNFIYNNIFMDYTYRITGTAGAVNFWNVSYDCVGETNVVGGSCMGGNYWSFQHLSDEDGDGIADTPYIVGNEEVDYLPLVNATNGGNVSICQFFEYPGTYYMDGDITDATGTCMEIFASNITLDCQGHTIDGQNTGRGISVDGASNNQFTNVTIRNCNVNDFEYGILADYVNDSLFKGNNVSSATEAGIYFGYFYDNRVVDNYMYDQSATHDEGMHIDSAGSGNNVSNNTFENNYYSLIIGDAAVDNNTIYNNFFNHTVSVPITAGSENFWNVSYDCSGPSNIVGGSCMGGNFWATSSGSGWSESCTDADPDGICDDQYNITTTEIDYLPVTEAPESRAPQINDVLNHSIDFYSATINWTTDEPANSSVDYGTTEALGSSVSNATEAKVHEFDLTGLDAGTLYYYNVTSCDGFANCNTSGPYNFTTLALSSTNVTKCQVIDTPGTYLLVNDSITGYSGTCIEIINSSVSFSCEGLTVDGVSTGRGIYVNGVSGDEITDVTVQNCYVNDFDYGIYLEDANDSLIINNNVTGADEIGLVVSRSDGNNITQNRIFEQNTPDDGVLFANGATSNYFHNNHVYDNYYGFVLSGETTDGNYIYNNFINNTVDLSTSSTDTADQFWNVSYDCAGPSNILGGSCMGGNYWPDRQFQDNDGDGIGDTPKGLGEGEVDYLPLVNGSNSGNITFCQRINHPGTYYMGANITGHSGDCMLIDTGNVTLDCQGYLIDGLTSGIAVKMWHSSTNVGKNITIRNCNINDFSTGISMSYINSSLLIQNNISGSDGSAVSFQNSQANNLTQSKITGASTGVHFSSISTANHINNNTIKDNSEAMYFYGGQNPNNYIYNNIFDNDPFEIDLWTDSVDEYWNTTYDCSAGPNIVGGSCMGGNYWVGQEFQDNDADGIGDVPFGIGDNDVDYLPLVNASNSGNISFCQEITYAGTYYLAGNITDASTNCIEIIASNVTFDCQGYNVDGQSSGIGIYVQGSSTDRLSNVTVKNCIITDFSTGIGLSYADDSLIIGNNAAGGSSTGISLSSSDNNNITQNYLADYTGGVDEGVYLNSVTGNHIHNNTIVDNYYGLYFFTGTSGNYIYNNFLNNTQTEVYIWSTSIDNYWNTTYDCSAGPNIIGGSCMGGNFWVGQEFQDNDADGIGDTPYGIEDGDTDFLPLVNASNSGNITICQEITYPGFYYLGADIVDASSNCIDIVSSNVTFDCNGYSLDGQTSGNGVDVGVNSANRLSNITIKNCEITDFSFGIYLSYTDDSLVKSVNTSGGSNGGIALGSSERNNITGNRFEDATGSLDEGIALSSYAINNTFSNNTVLNNYYSITTTHWSADGNVFFDNVFQANNFFLSSNSGADNFYNTTYQCGTTNIVGGSCIGGNYWVGQEFQDNDADGIGDTPFTVYGDADQYDFFPLVNASNSGNITVCQDLTYPGTYYLGADIINESGSCIFIRSSDVTFDCNGFTLDGQTSGSAIWASSTAGNEYENVTIKGCEITEFGNAVYFNYVDNSRIINSNFSDGDYYGIYMGYSENNTISGNRITGYSDSLDEALFIDYISTGNNITNNTFSNNYRTFDLDDSRIDSNYIYNNFINDTNANDIVSGATNFWNVTYSCSGKTNILGGSCIGGNYWADSSGTGWSETCDDFDADGVCDDQYNITASEADFLPLTYIPPAEVNFVSPTPDAGNITTGYLPINVSTSGFTTDNITIFVYNDSGLVLQNSSATNPFFWNITGLAAGTVYVNATANESGEPNVYNTSTRVFEIQAAPTQDTPILNATDNPDNSSLANLTVYPQNVAEVNGDSIYYTYDWRLNGSSIMLVNMPFNLEENSTALDAITDYSTSGNDGQLGGGTADNAPTWNATGLYGGAYYFDGSNDQIDLGDIEGIDGATELSMMAWVKIDDLDGDSDIFSKGEASATNPILMWRDELGGGSGRTNTFSALVSDGSNYAQLEGASGLANDNEWHHVAFTFEAGSSTGMRLYIDGEEDANSPLSTASIPALASNANAVWVGRSSSAGRETEGHIDQVRIYNRTLSAEQIARIVAEENESLTTSTLVSNETSVSDVWESCITLTDSISDSTTKCSNNVTVKDPKLVSFVAPTPAAGNVTVDYLGINVSVSGFTTDNLTIYLYNDSGLVSQNSSATSPFFWNFSSLAAGRYFVNATGNESGGSEIYSSSTRTYHVQGAPTHAAPTLNSSLNQSNSSANLTSYPVDAQDPNNDPLYYTHDWRLNGTSIMLINAPFNLVENSVASGAVLDYSTFGSNGTLGAGVADDAPVWNSSGKVGGAYRFDGSDDFIDFGDLSLVDGATELTVMAWVYIEDLDADGDIVSKGAAQDTEPFLFWRDDVGSATGRTNTFSVVAGDGTNFAKIEGEVGQSGAVGWYHVAFTFEAGISDGMKLYVDGVEDANSGVSTASISGIEANAESIRVGKSTSAGREFKGLIDQFKIFNRSLSQDQIQQIIEEENNSYANATLLSNETSLSNDWQSCLTLSDSLADSTTRCSNTVSIVNEESNAAPVIDSVQIPSAKAPIKNSVRRLKINFTVTDSDGVADLNDSSAAVNLSFGGVTRSSSACSATDDDADSVTYNCSVFLQHYDLPGSWAVNVSVQDSESQIAYNSSESFTYNSLTAFSFSPASLVYGSLTVGASGASGDPLVLDNQGNVNITQINITGYDLKNATTYFAAGNFTVNVSDGAGQQLLNATPITITGASLPVDTDSTETNESLYFWVSIPSSQQKLDYDSAANWIIDVE